MGMTIDTPFIAHSELTDEIYVIDKKTKYCVTDQVMKAVVATNRAIPKADYENRLKADMVAMLTEIQLEIEEEAFDMTGLVYIPNIDNANVVLMDDLNKIIQQKINSLKEA